MNSEKAALYRAIMRVFTEAKARFALHLRPVEVLDVLASPGPERTAHGARSRIWSDVDLKEVDNALDQLCDWGNLAAHPDTTDVATIEEFYRPRFLFQLTPEGEAAERAVAVYEESLRQPGELQSAALSDIHALLEELAPFVTAAELDDGAVHRALTALRSRFQGLTSKAQSFIGSLQRTIDLQGIEVEVFLAYKELLIDYLERFIGELVVATADIASALERIESGGVNRLLEIAARRELADRLPPPSEEDVLGEVRLWQAQWAGLRAWFISTEEKPSQAEVLRARARSSIPALLNAVAAIHDRRVAKSDRSADLRTLARWFAEADSDRQAHCLWRAAFGLTPARHLRVDHDTLDQLDQIPVGSHISWHDAPPLRISPRLRRLGRHVRRGKPLSVIDRTAEKALLAEQAQAEAEQIREAQRRLATGKQMRLSEIGEFNPAEFHLFLELLGEALAVRAKPRETVQATSSDGALEITLSPTEDGARAVIETTWGRFSGDDHFVTIRDLFENIDSEANFPQAAGVAPNIAAVRIAR